MPHRREMQSFVFPSPSRKHVCSRILLLSREGSTQPTFFPSVPGQTPICSIYLVTQPKYRRLGGSAHAVPPRVTRFSTRTACNFQFPSSLGTQMELCSSPLAQQQTATTAERGADLCSHAEKALNSVRGRGPAASRHSLPS